MSGFNIDSFSILGEELLIREESVKVADALNGKDVVGLYFSAHWCPPCRRFTPILSNIYNDLKANDKSIEIVFISSDSSEESFLEYYQEMPWLALPYSNRDLKQLLSEKYDCNGIPYLVLLDGKTGMVITQDGRTAITEGGLEGFPYDSESIARVKAAKYQIILSFFSNWNVFGEDVIGPELIGKEAVAIIFGNAGSQTPLVSDKLVQCYENLSDRLAVIYISHNVTNQDEEDEFQSKMPSSWIKIKSSENIIIQSKGIFGNIDVPTVYVMSGNCAELFSEDASSDIYYRQASGFPWSKEAVEAAEKEKQEKVDALKEKIKIPGVKFLEDAKLVTLDNNKSISALEGNTAEYLSKFDLVGLYFSAHWCGPCRQFTPTFADEYHKLKAMDKNIQVVFVSSDKDEESFRGYFADMPWLALDYEQRELKEILNDALDVDGIPTLVWVRPETGDINVDGRRTIEVGAEWYPWTEEQIAEALAQKKARAVQKSIEVEKSFRDANSVVIRNHRCEGDIDLDYTLTFNQFNTFIADVKLSGGKFYYEVEVKKIQSIAQFGWATEGFTPSDTYSGAGVGDDDVSWGFDGVRQCKWGDSGDSSFGSEWKDGDILGLAIDLTADGDKNVSFSVNGSFDKPDGIAFSGINVDWITPALTAQSGVYRVNFGDRPFSFNGPDLTYVSVHTAMRASVVKEETECVGEICAGV